MENVLSYVPNKQREQIEPELKALFYQKNRAAADQAVAAFIEKYQGTLVLLSIPSSRWEPADIHEPLA